MLQLRRLVPALARTGGALRAELSTAPTLCQAAGAKDKKDEKKDDLEGFELLPPGCSMIDPAYERWAQGREGGEGWRRRAGEAPPAHAAPRRAGAPDNPPTPPPPSALPQRERGGVLLRQRRAGAQRRQGQEGGAAHAHQPRGGPAEAQGRAGGRGGAGRGGAHNFLRGSAEERKSAPGAGTPTQGREGRRAGHDSAERATALDQPAACLRAQEGKKRVFEDEPYVYLPPGSSMREPGYNSMSDPGTGGRVRCRWLLAGRLLGGGPHGRAEVQACAGRQRRWRRSSCVTRWRRLPLCPAVAGGQEQRQELRRARRGDRADRLVLPAGSAEEKGAGPATSLLTPSLPLSPQVYYRDPIPVMRKK